jgi:uncharacterized membrane-anchored protein
MSTTVAGTVDDAARTAAPTDPPDGAGAERAPARRARGGMSKVPEMTAIFWIAKVLTTGMGETTSDFLAHRFSPYVAVALGAVGLVAGLTLQARARRYVAWIYWLAVVMVSVFGTMAADILHVALGVPYAVSAAFYAIVLAGVLMAWQRSEKTLSIHSIVSARREAFYWSTVVATFAVGTATGDLTARTLHLGYLTSGLLFAAIMAIPAIGYRFFRLNAIAAFWFAYVITRPLGASFADWIGVSHSRGGLGVGTGVVSVVLIAAIGVVVAYLTVSKRDVRVPAVST